MDQIKELGNILQKESPDFFSELVHTDSKKSMLFRAIMEGIVRTDNEASMLIYGTIDQGKKYQMLKRNLKEKLITQLNSHNHKSHLNYTLIEADCKEKLNLATNLLTKNVFHNAEKLLNQVIRKAEAYYLFNILVEASLLYREISSIKGYPEQVSEWNRRIDEYSKISNYHLKAKGIFDFFRAHFIHYCSLQPAMAKQAQDAEAQTLKWLSENDSPVLSLYLIHIRIHFAYHNNQMNLVETYNNDLKKHLIQNSFLNSKVFHFNTMMHEARFHLVNGEIHLASELISTCLQNYDYKSFLKFEAQAVNFSIKIKEEQYEQAGEILNEVFSTYEFSLFYPEAKASWHIRRAYLYFILYAEQNTYGLKKYAADFGTSSIIRVLDQNCKKLSKDKLGYNIQYLIIRLLLTWQNTDEETYYTGKNLQLYFYRNLKELKEQRIKSFVKLLSVIAINEFSEESINEKKELFTQEFINKEYPYKFDLNELIPFEKIFKYLSE